jgi:alpha-L-fucosidase
LCTKYGKIDIWWWDAVAWGGMFTKEMWDSEDITRMIRELQPGIAINNRASLPADFDTPEQHLGDFQEHRPWETCIPVSTFWCYSGHPARSFDELVHLLVGAATGNGNLLASWGPHWDGAFDEAQKQRLFEVGEWLNANGESIYGTRGGPWKPTPWGGSTRKGNTAYIHLFQLPAGDLLLPAIPGLRVTSAELLADGTPVAIKQSAQLLALRLPAQATVKGALVVALTMDAALDGLPSLEANAAGCSFALDPVTYGAVVSRAAKVLASSTSSWMPADGGASLVADGPTASFAVHTAEEAAPFVVIDLGEAKNVTGVFLGNAEPQNAAERMATLHASVSVDGAEWTEVWKADKTEPSWEFAVTSLVSGALRPGRNVRYLRLQTHPATPAPLLLKQVDIWAK